MKTETLINLIICSVCFSLALAAVAIAIKFGAWWNLVPGALFALLGYLHYVDSEYGIESVQAYINRKFIKG